MQCLHEIVYKFKIFYFIIYYGFLTYIFGILEKVLIYCIIFNYFFLTVLVPKKYFISFYVFNND